MSYLIQSLRETIHCNFPKTDELFQIEKRLPIFPNHFSKQEVASPSSSRVALLKDFTKERLQSVFSKIFKKIISTPQSSLSHQKPQLIDLQEKLHSSDYQAIIESFSVLPQELRDWLCSAIGTHAGVIDETNYGYKQIQENPKILLSNQPLIFLNGTNLVDQLIHWIDQNTLIESQKHTVQTLNTISHLLNTHASSHLITSTIETLPAELQWQMHGDVYAFSHDKQDEQEWGKYQISRNPRILKELRNPHHPQNNLFEQYLFQEHKKLENLEFSKDLEELERLTIVLQVCHPRLRKEHLKWSSSRVHHWVKELELEKHCPNHARHHPLFTHRGAQAGLYGTHFSLFAPHARKVTLVLTAFGNEEESIPMQRNSDGTWSTYTDKAPIGRSYRYRIENCHGNVIDRTDPVSFSTFNDSSDPKKTQSVVSSPQTFPWTDGGWMDAKRNAAREKRPLSIYEVYVESWKKKHGAPLNFRELAHELAAYAKKMQFSHVELYGVLDNQGGWGYQVHNFFSPNQRLGNCEDFQYLVNHLHENGIGVILDWIPAHYNPHPWEVSLHDIDGTNVYGGGKSEWGTEYFNLSGEEPRRFLHDNARYWCEVMHIDGLRVDAVSRLTKYAGGISFLKDLNKSIHDHNPGTLMIAEDTSGCPQLTTPVEHGGIGFDFQWGIYEGMKLRWFLQTPPSERSRHHREKFMDQLYGVKNGEKKIITHSHDEMANRHGWEGFPERHDKTLYQITALSDIFDKFADVRNFIAWLILSPSSGALMNMGDEFAQKRSWDVGVNSWNGSLDWDALDPYRNSNSYFHSGMQRWVADLNAIYCQKGRFWKQGAEGFNILCDHPENNVIAFERIDAEGRGVIVVHNFSQGNWNCYNIPFGGTRSLERLHDIKIIAHSENPSYGGKDKYTNIYPYIHRDTNGNPTHFTMGIPPFSTIIFEKII